MTPREAILKNASLVLETLGPLSGLGAAFGYNRESVAWVEGFIERQRLRPEVKENPERMVHILGSFLGECIIHAYGGEWQERDGSWGIFFDASKAAFPFNKVRKQFDKGKEDSILSFFELIGPVILNKPLPGPE